MKRSYMSDDDMMDYNGNFVKYPNILFKVTHVDKEGRADEVVT